MRSYYTLNRHAIPISEFVAKFYGITDIVLLSNLDKLSHNQLMGVIDLEPVKLNIAFGSIDADNEDWCQVKIVKDVNGNFAAYRVRTEKNFFTDKVLSELENYRNQGKPRKRKRLTDDEKEKLRLMSVYELTKLREEFERDSIGYRKITDQITEISGRRILSRTRNREREKSQKHKR